MMRRVEFRVEPPHTPRPRQAGVQTCAWKLRRILPLFETSQTSIDCAALSAIKFTKPNHYCPVKRSWTNCKLMQLG
jgi:hypothetical protein